MRGKEEERGLMREGKAGGGSRSAGLFTIDKGGHSARFHFGQSVPRLYLAALT